MPAEAQLEMQALDIDAMAWDDLKREVVVGDPDVQLPSFRKDATSFVMGECDCGAECGENNCVSCECLSECGGC